MIESYDLIVLGGGRAANLAIAAAKDGWKVALIERDRLGGTCPNRGCVPSKLLVGFADAARHVREAGRHFIDADYHGADLRKIFASVNEYIAGVDGRYQGRVGDAGVTLVRGEGRFTGHKRIEAGGRILTAEKIVIATGSRPNPPPYADLGVWTSDDLFPLAGDPPRSLLVIGGGVIACEMAAFFAAVGVGTTLAVRKDRLLGKEDPDIERVFQQEFGKYVRLCFGASLVDLSRSEDGFAATFETHEGEVTQVADRVLFAIGRTPNSESLDLAETGIRPDEKGFIPVNEHLETIVSGIYATGDVNGRHMLQHAAAQEVHFLRQKFLKGRTGPIDDAAIGHGIFSHPEVASIGKTEEELKERGTPYVAVFEDWLASARVEAMRIDYPRVKLLVSPEDHSILGCHLIGPEASTLLHQVITVMKLKNDVRELAETIFVHPALNECLLAAAVKAVDEVKKFRKK
ncbi:FAD-dependent oxidoreductase [Luteolibacter yonseiensis]|uniref:Dihydrolipoyl dehydrogenase n=1 Tax=Luteolibacter yonseiensis TaxID=1144680 RepID=A0A934V6E9_9BACT|nr:FAD-dependent oxidoreductase [Luteolibacter yonseiensis]MBK1814957.1 FAD-dependent oxidoreductase [Luteolibacter yonseiensis]